MESTRRVTARTYEINRAWLILSRDLAQFVARPVRDEFGALEPALQGGPAARFPLSLTRTGWHNPNGVARSNLQRVNYRLEDNTLWRDIYPVLDRAPDTEPLSAVLLEGVESLEFGFLDTLGNVQAANDNVQLQTRDWPESWVADTSNPDAELAPPVALEVRLTLEDWGEMRRLYALPPL